MRTIRYNILFIHNMKKYHLKFLFCFINKIVNKIIFLISFIEILLRQFFLYVIFFFQILNIVQYLFLS